ncbi:MAG: hypothetical protein K9J16_07590 [Melioribacteraceae bacterium]|nr:hypothetical protein [Melioribacteraceae bacterium]MCF8353456.1 hypothetical protein [Melioribacteraceae bacterium]MCF8393944.1 hypothetical protein [Melioribacteraceae bacterium]MCF8419017.1 hypothetical protein [Melioribacteraceae bacterium]
MRNLSFLIILIFSAVMYAQSPHGDGFDLECSTCHTTETWAIKTLDLKFDHNTQTLFELEGQHKSINCIDCHESLVFSGVDMMCSGCHTDVHENTLGEECQTCHDPSSWVVKNITEIHQLARFPLIGNHNTADCGQCHVSSSGLRFEPIGTDCIDCHREDYVATNNPNHAASGFSQDCTECHSLDQREWSFASITHDFFPLTGGHNITDCYQCHETSTFTGLSSDCYSCHQPDFEGTANPNHVELSFSTNCIECHTTNPGWQPASYPVHFDLTGIHLDILGDCNSCHVSDYVNTIEECTYCHQDDFNATANPNHVELNFETDCTTCHNQNAWQPADYPVHYDLVGVHTSIISDCESCHQGDYVNTVEECFSCHESDYNSTSDPNHAAANFPVECTECHSQSAWEPSTFNHDASYFPIYSGEHRGEWDACSDCHTSSTNYSIFECINCHEHNRTDMDDEHSGVSGYVYQSSECLACHPNGDEDGAFNHSSSAFPLEGAHSTTDCSGCHISGYSGTSSECETCHIESYNTALIPDHAAAGISKNCDECHSSTEWANSEFNHTAAAGFELSGRHAEIQQCSDCHEGNTTTADPQCLSCHEENYNTAENHIAQNFPTDCEMCHSAIGWEETSFDHATTDFPLTGSHVDVQCSDCHTEVYSGTAGDCNSCHETDFTSAVNPNHVNAGLSQVCEDCHNTTNWAPSEFTHAVTGFELSGKHAEIQQCSDCHEGNTTTADPQCLSCHEENYNTAENHIAQNFPTDCEMCHSSIGWEETSFDHATTDFPLTGSHVDVQCSECHTEVYSGTASDCNSCHETDFTSAVNPNHVNAGLSQVCEDCHNTTAWIPSEFSHAETGFELLGQHAEIQCSDCHVGTVEIVSSECFACHEEDYNATEDHLAQGFPTECGTCHSPVNWEETHFDHNETDFPLTGAHLEIMECGDCHENGFTGTSTVCFDCHQTDFNSTTNPDHISLGLENDCSQCHSTQPDWKPATFEVHNSFFELVGAHASISNQCIDCHNNDYNNTPVECVGCHEEDYNTATDPNHLAAFFPHTCQDCHSQIAWEPSTFEHDAAYFPIYSGEHNGEWNTCADCHVNQADFTFYECINCHEHSRTEMDDEHSGVADYVYESTACYDCHPNGDEGDKLLKPKLKEIYKN